MSDSSDASSNDRNDPMTSFFSTAMRRADQRTTPNRVQELKRILFDLAYLIMNADGAEHISEKMLVQKLSRKMEREDSVDVGNRADELDPLIEEGMPAIRSHVEALADTFTEHAGDYGPVLADSFLDLLKGLIVADADVSPEEALLFDLLTTQWDIDKSLPQS